MADRYQDRRFAAHDDYGRGTDQHGQNAESDPLAELARLIGQTDPFAMGRANARAQESAPPPQYDDEADYQPSPVHPLHRHAQPPAPVPPQQAHYQYQDEQQYAEEGQPDPSRYDDALYGQIESS